MMKDNKKKRIRKKRKIVRVKYMVTLTGEERKPVSVNKERILSELVSIDSAHIQQVLEEELQATEQPALGQQITGSTLITKITELKPTGDDDQM
jgi:hypothetical protein